MGAGAGVSGGAGASGAAGGGLVVEGCDWYDKMLKTGEGLKGPVRFFEGGAKAQVWGQDDNQPGVGKVKRIVDATSEHVFAVGEVGAGQEALVAFSLNPGTGDFENATYLDGGPLGESTGFILPLQMRRDYDMLSGTVDVEPYFYYAVPSSKGYALRRIKRMEKNYGYPYEGVETIAADIEFNTVPKLVVPMGSPFFEDSNESWLVMSEDRVVWLRKGQIVDTLDLGWAEVLLQSITVEGGDLYVTGRNAGSTEGSVVRVPMKESSFDTSGIAYLPTSSPGAIISFPDSGEAPALAFVDREGISKLLPYFEAPELLRKYQAPSLDLVRPSWLEYGISPVTFDYSYLFDVSCGDGRHAPAVLKDQQGATPVMRVQEKGFPFVLPTPLATRDDVPGGPRLSGNKFGIYLVR